ncbi:hypothetical protein B7494_g6249 [Chlorociboria aeruginascens]|nr:hypothetical protein B7494_g6249 [Chlorociboria aeruginascens]
MVDSNKSDRISGHSSHSRSRDPPRMASRSSQTSHDGENVDHLSTTEYLEPEEVDGFVDVPRIYESKNIEPSADSSAVKTRISELDRSVNYPNVRSRSTSPVKKPMQVSTQSTRLHEHAPLTEAHFPSTEGLPPLSNEDRLSQEKGPRSDVDARAAAKMAYEKKDRPNVVRRVPQQTILERTAKTVGNYIMGGPPHANTASQAPKHSFRTSEREIDNLRQILHDQNQEIIELKQRTKELEGHRDWLQEAYTDIVRKNQERSFEQMDTGRWLPQDESKVKSDLDRIKRAMKTWAKDAAIKDMALLNRLPEEERQACLNRLSDVVKMENGGIPPALSTPKSPALLLNALVAHDVYLSFFVNPFFFLSDGRGDQNCCDRLPPEVSMQNMWITMAESNPREAHHWRSQMLRLLLPPLKPDSSETDVKVNSITTDHISSVAIHHARTFLLSSARHLIPASTPIDSVISDRIHALYVQAATLAYSLWTRRTAIKVGYMNGVGDLRFNVDDESMEPHTLLLSAQMKGIAMTNREFGARTGLYYELKRQQERKTYRTSSGSTEGLETVLKVSGVNTVRQRVWVNPSNGDYNLAYNVPLAKPAQAAGLNVYLDLHLVIRGPIRDIKSAGHPPVTTSRELLHSASSGIKDSSHATVPKIMIHLDNGWNLGTQENCYKTVLGQGPLVASAFDTMARVILSLS